eukprot:1272123-Rhodomonas_salina.1
MKEQLAAARPETEAQLLDLLRDLELGFEFLKSWGLLDDLLMYDPTMTLMMMMMQKKITLMMTMTDDDEDETQL